MTAKTHYDVFLSHSDADESAVETLAGRLHQEAGLRAWFAKEHLIPGTPRQEALEKALSQSHTCAVLIGPGGLSGWHQEGMRVAIQIRVEGNPDYRIIPVLLPGADLPERGGLPSFLTRHTWVDFRPGLDDAHAFYLLVCGIKGIAPSEGERPAEEAICPYLGLRPFQEEHARFFFGRDALTQWLVEDVRGGNFLAVIGPSGSGKSSLALAGLIPALRRGALPGSGRWPIRVLTPGPEPLNALVATLMPLLSPSDPIATRRSLTKGLRADPRELARVVGQILAKGNSRDIRLVLLVDQFEETFTLCHDEAERIAFIAALLDAARPDRGELIGVLTMRADFYSRAATYPDLAARLERRQRVVSPMDEADLRRAVEEPARLVDLHFEKGLVDTILDDAGREPGVLPLVQHTLWELWERRRGEWLTFDAYREIGGVEGALAHRAEEVYASFAPEEQETTRRVLLRLTQPGEGTEDTRRRASKAELVFDPTQAAGVERVVDKLTDARLLTTARDQETGQEMTDVAHEALIRGWPRLQSWVNEDRVGLLTHRRLTDAALEWEKNERDDSYLYRGARLDEAEKWANVHTTDMSTVEREFLETSSIERRRQTQEREDQRRKEKQLADQQRAAIRLRRLVRGLVLMEVVTVIATLILARLVFVVEPGPVSIPFPRIPLALSVGGLLLLLTVLLGQRWWRALRVYAYDDVELAVEAMAGETYQVQVTGQKLGGVSTPYETCIEHSLMAPYLELLEVDQISATELRQLGQLLFEVLWNDTARQKLLESTRPGGKRWRLRLNLAEAPELLTLPWEFAHGGEEIGFLGVNPDTALVRFLPPDEQFGLLKTTWPLKILVAWAEPVNLLPVQTEMEVEALRSIAEMDRMQLRILPHATPDTFRYALEEGADIVHFIGHGAREAGQIVLYFEDEDGYALSLTDSELVSYFQTISWIGAPKLVVISGSTARGALDNLALALLRQGEVSAVVGFRYPVGAESAASFVRSFYRTLVRNGQVDYAISMARGTLYAQLSAERRDWGAPVLYMQVADGRILK